MALGKLSPLGDPAPDEPKRFAAVVQYEEAAPVNSYAPSKLLRLKAFNEAFNDYFNMAGVAGRFEKDKVKEGAVYFLNE